MSINRPGVRVFALFVFVRPNFLVLSRPDVHKSSRYPNFLVLSRILCPFLVQVSGPDSPRSVSLLSSSLSVLKSLCSHPYARDERSAKDWRKLLQSAMVTIVNYANVNHANVNHANGNAAPPAEAADEEEDDYPGS